GNLSPGQVSIAHNLSFFVFDARSFLHHWTTNAVMVLRGTTGDRGGAKHRDIPLMKTSVSPFSSSSKEELLPMHRYRPADSTSMDGPSPSSCQWSVYRSTAFGS